MLRFGKYLQTTGPGYNWHLPWPIERKIIVNVSHQYSVVDDAMYMLHGRHQSGGGRNPHLFNTFQPDALKLLAFKVRDVEDTLTQVSESAMREAVGQAPLDKALAFDVSITDRAKFLLQRTLDNYDMGIHILSVNLTGVNVPDAVQDAQRDAIKADKDRQRAISKMQKPPPPTATMCCRGRAALEAAKVVLDAEAYRLQVVALAQGETARFDEVLAQYEHAPAVTRERMYLDTMGNVYKNSRKVIVDTKNGNSMIYLPHDKLIAPGPQSVSNPNDTMTVPAARVPEVQGTQPEDPARARGVR